MTYRLRPTARLTAAVSTLALAAALASCAGEDASTAGAGGDSGDLVPVTVALLPTANMAPLHLGLEQGFFEDEGLEVTTQTVQTGSEMITGALGGTFDFICAGYVPVYTAISQGLPLRFISGNDAGGATPEDDWQIVVAGADSDVTTAADLQTATIGVNALKGVAEIQVRASLEEQGIDGSRIELTEIPFPEMPAALEEGRLDAALVPEPFVTAVLDAGGHVVDTPYAVLGESFPNGAWQVAQPTIDGDAETVAAFTRAVTRSVDYAAENPDAVRAIIPTFTQVPAEVADRMRLPVFDSTLDLEKMTRLLDYTERYGTIETRPAEDELVYTP